MSFFVAQIPGCKRLCRELNSVSPYPVGVHSQVETGSTTTVNDGEDSSAWICGSVACDLAIAAKSTIGGVPEIKALASIHESVSATTLSM